MKKVLKWTAIILGSIIGLLILAIAAIYAISEVRFNRAYQVPAAPVEIPKDPAAIAYGEHLANIRGCKACHGGDLSGQIEFQDPMVGVIANANLTGGRGSEVSDYTIEDWARAVRQYGTASGRMANRC